MSAEDHKLAPLRFCVSLERQSNTVQISPAKPSRPLPVRGRAAAVPGSNLSDPLMWEFTPNKQPRDGSKDATGGARSTSGRGWIVSVKRMLALLILFCRRGLALLFVYALYRRSRS